MKMASIITYTPSGYLIRDKHRALSVLMKPFKLFACLVALHFTVGLTLEASAPQEFRDWTDQNGRQMTARLLSAPTAGTIKIERKDGQVFTVPLRLFSDPDQAYVRAYIKQQKVAAGTASGDDLADATEDTWSLLRQAGSQPATLYADTPLEEVIAAINQTFTTKRLKTPDGDEVQIRAEPADLAGRIKLSGQLPSMNTAYLIQTIAYNNNLVVKTDGAGTVVLMDKNGGSSGSFLGVPVN